MPIRWVQGDIFLSNAQTLAHGVNCRGRMGAGIALEIRNRFPEMHREYRRRCHHGELAPGSYFLWKESAPWILNLATQDEIGKARFEYVREVLENVAGHYRDEGILSLAMPRIAAGLGGLNWSEVRNLIEGILGVLPLPVVVYGEFLEGIAADEPCLEDHEEVSAGVGPVIFGRGGDPRWRVFSNFSPTPIVIEGRDYPTVEHYYQASKASTDWEHELIRAARSPKEAKLLGCRVQLRPDWENVKVNLMRTGLLAKFRQHPRCRALLLETGDVPIHEVSPGDNEWGRINGSGRDLLGRLLVEVRAILRREDLGDDPESAP